MSYIIHILIQNGFDVMCGKVGSADANNSLDAAQCPNKQGNIRHCKFYLRALYSTYSATLNARYNSITSLT